MSATRGFSRSGFSKVAVALAAVAVSAGVGRAQSTAADIVGVVRDPSGAVIPGVAVRVVQLETNFTRQTKTDVNGMYEFRILPPGAYTLTAEAAGFKKYINERIPLTSRQVLRIDITMEVGSVSENVTVTAEVPSVTTDTGTVSESRGSRLISEGPQGTPVMAYFGQETSRYSVLLRGAQLGFYKAAGSRGNGWEVSTDGNPGQWTYMMLQIPHQALAEQKITVVNAPAEYRAPVTLDGVTKQGTNSFHGSVTFSLSHDRLNALPATAPSAARGPQLPSHNWNVTAGGPLYFPKIYDGRNRTFLFLSAERNPPTERSSPIGALLTVPTNAMREGNFAAYFAGTGRAGKALPDPLTGQPFPNQVIPRSRWNRAAVQAIDKYYPAPNVPTANPDVPFRNFNGPTYSKNTWSTLFVRFDQKISNANTAGFSYTQSPAVSITNQPLPTIGNNALFGHSKMFSWTDTHILSPRIVNEVRIGWYIADNERFGNGGKPAAVVLSALGIDLGADAAFRSAYRQAPNLSISGYDNIGSNVADDQRWQRWLSIRDNLSVQLSRHTLKAGFDERRHRDDRLPANAAVVGTQTFSGTFTGDAFADFLLGLPSSTSRYTPGVNFFRRRYYELGLYVQDDFKATPRLTLNLGLRFDRFSPRRELSGAQVSFNPATGGLVFIDEAAIKRVHPAFPTTIPRQTAAQAGYPPRLYNAFWALNPRFGFAYRLSGSHRLVLRGAYGVFATDSGWLNNDFRIVEQGPFALSETFTNSISGGTPVVTLDRPFPATVGRGPSSINTSGGDPRLNIPVLHQYNLILEKQLRGEWVAKLGYVGSWMSHLWTRRDYNRPPASLIPFSPSRLLYPNFNSITYIEQGGHMNHSSMQAGLAHRFSSGLELDALFQWISEISDVPDDGSSNFGAAFQNPYCRPCERAKNPFVDSLDFRATFLYELPLGKGRPFGAGVSRVVNGFIGGWNVSGIVDMRNGRPSTVVFSGVDTSNTNLRGGRADVLPGCNIRQSDGKSGPYLNIACFAIPQKGTFGNASPSIFRKPGSWDISGAVYKYFPLFREEVKLRLNAVFNNLFNHPTWDQVGNDITVQSTFGKLLSQGAAGRWQGPRTILIQAQVQW